MRSRSKERYETKRNAGPDPQMTVEEKKEIATAPLKAGEVSLRENKNQRAR